MLCLLQDLTLSPKISRKPFLNSFYTEGKGGLDKDPRKSWGGYTRASLAREDARALVAHKLKSKDRAEDCEGR